MNLSRIVVIPIAVLLWTQCSGASFGEFDGPIQFKTTDYTDQNMEHLMLAEPDSTKSISKNIPKAQSLVESELTQLRTSLAQSAQERSRDVWRKLAPQLELRLAKQNLNLKADVPAM